MKRVVTFGEIMTRFDAPFNQRLRQAMPGSLHVTFAGAEANVAVSIAHLGGCARFVTMVPANPITDACVAVLDGFGVDTSHVTRAPVGRFGAYYVETGANQRPSTVVYDRDATSIALVEPTAYDWDAAFADADWFHVTGITPALSNYAAQATRDGLEKARERGLTTSCDLNFRKKLWRWRAGTAPAALAAETMSNLLQLVDVLIANEQDSADVLGLSAEGSDVESGVISPEGYLGVARDIAARFPELKFVATTLRESISATHNNWGATLYDVEADAAFFAPRSDERYEPYRITSIVDRVGGGDSFAAALIFALAEIADSGPQYAVDFAAAASCLAHSIRGDFNLSSRTEVEALVGGSGSGRVVR